MDNRPGPELGQDYGRCEVCNGVFKKRGIKIHQSKSECGKILERRKSQPHCSVVKTQESGEQPKPGTTPQSEGIVPVEGKDIARDAGPLHTETKERSAENKPVVSTAKQRKPAIVNGVKDQPLLTQWFYKKENNCSNYQEKGERDQQPVECQEDQASPFTKEELSEKPENQGAWHRKKKQRRVSEYLQQGERHNTGGEKVIHQSSAVQEHSESEKVEKGMTASREETQTNEGRSQVDMGRQGTASPVGNSKKYICSHRGGSTSAVGGNDM